MSVRRAFEKSRFSQAAVALILAVGVPLLLFPIATRGFHRQAGRWGMLVVLIFVIGVPLLIGYFGLKNIKALICFNAAVGLCAVILSASYTYRPDFLTQIATMLAGFYVLALIIISIIAIFRLESCVPLAISLLCIVLIILSNRVGHRIRSYVFDKRLAQYAEAVSVMEDRLADERLYLYGDEVPERFRHLGYAIKAERDEQDVLFVTFLWGNSFPLKHVAFAYVSDGGRPRGWPFCERINEHWFRVGD
ncbi:MAG: hypothetical protein ACYTBJ_07920 [Planctomycetota bacterium]|jgi:hypothetical protein